MPSSVSNSDRRCACGRPAITTVCCLLCPAGHSRYCDEVIAKGRCPHGLPRDGSCPVCAEMRELAGELLLAAKPETSFVKFALLSEEEQGAAIRGRPTLHVEPVMVTPRSGPDVNKAKGVYHLQLGSQHTVLNARELAGLLALLETARERVKKWESELPAVGPKPEAT